MLASSLWPSSHDRHSTYLPPRPSPLSPRSANARVINHNHQYCSFDMPKQSSPSRLRFTDVPFSKRPIKQMPFSQRPKDAKSREAARETRRKLFLQQVAQKRDEKRFEERGEHLLRLDWKSERRRWEDEKARSASSWLGQPEEEDDVLFASQDEPSFRDQSQDDSRDTTRDNEPMSSVDQDEVERLRQHEEEEMNDMLALMDDQASQLSSRYGSDDEYDGIFSELIQEDDGGGDDMAADDFVIVERQGDVDMSG